MAKYAKILIKNLDALMRGAKLNQSQLASKLKIAPGNVNNWMNGKNVPTVETLENIATVFGVSLADLFKSDETPKPQIMELPDAVSSAIKNGNAELLAQITKKLGPVISALEAQGAEEVVVREMPKDKLQVFFNKLLRDPGLSADFYALVDGGADHKTLMKALLKELQAQEKGKKK